MSRAFVKETDGTVESLPDRLISEHPNLVTARGRELIEETVARLLRERAAPQVANDPAAQARIARDLRFWTSRLATAQVVPAPNDATLIRFGSTVTIARDDGRRQTYRIVGEDEADPRKGTLSYVSPVARALMGKKVGEEVRVGGSEAKIVEITTTGCAART